MELLDSEVTRPTQGGASYSLKHRGIRIVWMLCWKLLASWTPAPLHRWRIALLKLFGAEVDWSAHVYGSTKIWLPRNLTMGKHACLGPKVNCYSMAMISLEEYAIVSQGAFLCAGTHDVDDQYFQLIAKPILIQTAAWVAAEAFVGPGVTIGAHSVVGARCVAFKNTEANGIYVGNPAKLVRQRQLKFNRQQ